MLFMTLLEKGIDGDTTMFTLVPNAPVDKETHLVDYPSFADYLVTCEWVCL